MKYIPATILIALLAGGATAVNAGWQDTLKGILDSGEQSESASTQQQGAGLTDQEMNSGLLEALAVGIERAVDLLGSPGGYLNDPQVRIPMPDQLQTVETVLRTFGQDELADEFIETMNTAAEKAAPKTLDIFMDAISQMTVEDAYGILTGPDDAATQYFRRTAGPAIVEAIQPIISETTDQAGVTSAYKNVVDQGSAMSGGFLDLSSFDLDQYVTEKAVDGLFIKLAEQEQLIRTNPVARSTELLQKVFSAF